MRTTFFTILLLLALLLAGFVGMVAYYTFAPTTTPNPSSTRRGNDSTSPPSQGGDQGVVRTRPTLTATDPLRGNPAAPLTLIEFGDFQCAACAEVEPALQNVLQQYKDQVKLIWKDLPNLRLHPLAQRAAEAARCADEQGKFWEYHDRLLENGGAPGLALLSDTSFMQFSRELGLNGDQFQICLQSGRAAELVTRSLNEGILLRVDATPYFFVGERRFSGAASKEELLTIIETSLKKLSPPKAD